VFASDRLANRGISYYSLNPRGQTVAEFFKGFQVLHAALLIVSSLAFFIFFVRTRFWLPKYAHVLAMIGLAVGIWCASITPAEAPVKKASPTARFLFPLVMPAMVYFFFVFYGGQRAAFNSRFPKPLRCPSCDAEIASEAAASEGQQRCPHCGQVFG
jgi:hypothetical protein